MADILQVTNTEVTNYTAATSRAITWMQDNYGSDELDFAVPDDLEAMKQFKEEAEKAGLTFSVL